MNLTILTHASELITGEGFRKKDGKHPDDLDMNRIPDGALVYDDQKILWVGKTSELPKRFLKEKHKSLKNSSVIIPGLVDCHTHLVFGGDRSDEFARRCAGVTYEEIAKEGGGILTTVRETRQMSEEQLFRLSSKRLKKIIGYGIRGIEIKSGYGLDLETEIKQLRVIQRLRKSFPEIKIYSTFLGAHAIPPETNAKNYVQSICQKMIPIVAKNKLADSCDVFIDRGYFTRKEGRQILLTAKQYGLQIRVHGDELSNTESAKLAADLGALSVDHLLHISDKGIRALKNSNTVAVILPGTSFYLKTKPAPAKKLIQEGIRVAIASDYNPGSCPNMNPYFMMTLSALYQGLSAAEILCGFTYNACRALNWHQSQGTIEVGLNPIFTTLPVKRFEEVYYQWG
jgi:imidazolonepropionase